MLQTVVIRSELAGQSLCHHCWRRSSIASRWQEVPTVSHGTTVATGGESLPAVLCLRLSTGATAGAGSIRAGHRNSGRDYVYGQQNDHRQKCGESTHDFIIGVSLPRVCDLRHSTYGRQYQYLVAIDGGAKRKCASNFTVLHFGKRPNSYTFASYLSTNCSAIETRSADFGQAMKAIETIAAKLL